MDPDLRWEYCDTLDQSLIDAQEKSLASVDVKTIVNLHLGKHVTFNYSLNSNAAERPEVAFRSNQHGQIVFIPTPAAALVAFKPVTNKEVCIGTNCSGYRGS